MTSLRLDNLVLQNFRCFTSCEIAFHPRVTVLVAENGNGKTAVLDAASLVLSGYVKAMSLAEQFKKIARSDIRLVPSGHGRMEPRLPTRFSAKGIVADQAVQWASEVGSYAAKNVRPSTRELKGLKLAAEALDNDGALLPLVAFYGTGRLWSEHRAVEGRRTSVTDVTQRLAGYSDCLASSSSFKGVSAWYQSRSEEVTSPAHRESLRTNIALLTAVREAARTVLEPTGWSNLDWDPSLKALVADHPQNGRLPLSSLSDGVRTMLALVADVARRCASLNPQLSGDAARQTPGVLMIDEVDMHLHPRWQQLVLELLCQAFPTLQIIASTHSPHVLSTVDNSSIRVIRMVDGQAIIETPLLQTRGIESADVLATVMGVDPIPQLPEAVDLSNYRALIEDGQSESPRARTLRSKLIEHFSERHPVMRECDRLIRFQEFRLRHGTAGGA